MFNFNEFSMKEYMSNEITAVLACGIYHLEFGSLLQVHKAHPEWDISPMFSLASPNGYYASNGLMGEYVFVPYCAKSASVAVELMDWALYNKENYMENIILHIYTISCCIYSKHYRCCSS